MGARSRWLARAAMLAALLACAGCRDRAGRSEARPAEPAEPSAPPADAAPVPEASAAAEVLRRFAAALEDGDLDAARRELRLPPSLAAEEVDDYLRELAEHEHVTAGGVEALVAAGSFGSLERIFGDAGPNVAANAQLEGDGEGYAFGGPDAAAVLAWDGRRFQVVAVRNLATLEDGGE